MPNPKSHITASVIVPTYNRKHLLGYTLRALSQQSIDPKSFEIIVVDDGSSDNSKEVVDHYKSLLNIKYFYQEDQGYRVSTARNIGIEAAASDICILVDSGILLPSWGIEEHIKSHHQHSQPLAVLGYLYGLVKSEISNDPLKSLIDIDALDASLKKIKTKHEYGDFREEAFKKCSNDISNLPAPWIFFWTANVSFNKALFHENEHYFHEAFNGNWGWEDVEFGYRLFKKGAKFVLNPELDAIHYPHDKYKDFENASMVNLEKFNNMYRTPETQLLYDISIQDIDNVFLNDHIRERIGATNI